MLLQKSIIIYPVSPHLCVYDGKRDWLSHQCCSFLEPLSQVVSTGCLSLRNLSCVFPHHAFSTQMWDDFGGQALHLLGLVEEQVELNELGPCISYLSQACDAGRRRAIDGDIAQARGSVDLLELAFHMLMGSGCVVVDGKVDAFGDLE